MRRNETTDHLNHLIESTLDNVHEFKTFALHAQSDELRQSFERRAAALQNHIAELSDLMMEQGGKPSLHGTASGAVHRGLVRLKDAFGGLDDVDLLEESERASRGRGAGALSQCPGPAESFRIGARRAGPPRRRAAAPPRGTAAAARGIRTAA